MSVLVQLAILVATTLIQRALAPKVRNPMPALEDFQVPTAEYGRSIPWLFGTRKIKDPNIIWYGDLDRHVKTKDGAKYYTYYMGLHMEICIGPVDAVYKLWYGDKACWEGEQTASGLIQIEQPGLYGGRYKEGGIDGSFNLLFGEAGQGVNNYLEAQLGLPLSAFRDSFCIVGRKPALTANSTYIKPLLPLVKRIKKGWPDDDCWYPATAEIMGDAVSSGEWLYDTIMGYGATLFARFEDEPVGELGHMNGAPCVNTGAGPDGSYVEYGWPSDPLVSDGAQSIKMWSTSGGSPSSIRFPKSESYGYATNDALTLAMKVRLDADYSAASYHYLWHEGDHGETGNTGLGCCLVRGAGTVPDRITAIYWTAVTHSFVTASIDLPAPLVGGETHVFIIEIACIGGANDTGYIAARMGCEGTYIGAADFPAYPVAANTAEFGPAIGAAQENGSDVYQIRAALDNFAIFPRALTEDEAVRLAAAYCDRVGYDMNPAHIIYDVWVDTHQGMAEDPASIDAVAMAYAADLFFDERMGLSMYWTRQCAIEEFIGEVCRHAGALQTINPRTGQLKIIALRDDYDVSSLDTLTEDEVIEVVEWQDAADGEAVNTITVRWIDRDGADQATTYTSRASVQQHGVIAETRDYPGIATEALARRVAKRDVKEASSNLAKGKIKVNRAGWDKFPGDVFIFSHAPEGIEELVVRVLEIDTGTLTDGAITLTVVQDVFSLPLDVPEISEQGNEWTPPSTDPLPTTLHDVIELPYWALLDVLGTAETGTLDDGAGYLAALAAKPTPLTTDIDIWSRISPASYAEVRPEQACVPSATLVAALDRSADTAIDTDDLSQIEEVEAGWLVQIGTGATAEICRVTAIDVDAATVSVDRAILDTTPQTHDAATPLFFLPPSASEWARDPTQYTAADVVDVKLQTGTASGELAVDGIPAIDITLAARQIRPYPPGSLEINSEAHPTLLLGPLTVTWAERDRVVQGTTIVTQDDATDYGPESGTTYNAYAYDDDTGTLLDSDTGISAATWSPVLYGSHMLRIEIESERDGYACWQRQVRSFEHIDSAAITDTDGENLRDTDGHSILEA